MANETLIEQRLSAVEKAVARLQDERSAYRPPANWLEQVIGSLRDEPAFDEVIALGREFRAADRPEGEDRP